MMVALIIILPLNWIRNKIEFASNKEQFELAVDIIAHENQEINDQPQIHKLAPELEHLSLDGVVLTMHRPTSKGFFFFTFRGAPEGVAGFLKITGNGKLDNYISDITPDSVVVKTLKDNWYYISTE